ncbi:MAG: LemA family protein [Bacteroides nordii]
MVIVIIFVLLIIFVGVVYNSLVRKKNQIENAFATIDVMLKKRYDLIPNLVATVRQYAKYEEGVLIKLTEMRSKSYVTLSNSEKANLDDIFTHAHTGLLAIAESYPELKASDNFMQLQRSINETEEQLAAARRTYNACVTDYNNAVQTFPSNLLAGIFGFNRKGVWAIQGSERITPDVKELLNS